MKKMKLFRIVLIVLLTVSIFGCSSKETVNEEVSEETSEEKIEFETFTKNNHEYYKYHYQEIPVALGYPEHESDGMKDITEETEVEQINTFADALMYVKKYPSDQPKDYVDRITRLIYADYDSAGRAEINMDNDYYAFFYVEKNGNYYLFDVFHMIRGGNSWLMNVNEGNCVFDSKESMKEKLDEQFNSNRTVFVESKDYGTATAPNGMILNLNSRLLEEVFEYCGVQIPLGLGLPELTYEEIDKLIEEKDYEKTSSRIKTLADAVCYLSRAGFRFINNDSNIQTEEYYGPDPGNLFFYVDRINFKYTISGKETLMIGQGQCSSMSTCLNYLLYDNYPEIGYIDIKYSDDDGHAMIYIKNENRYYLINPVDYVLSLRPDDTYDSELSYQWLDFYSDEKGSANTLEELMEEFCSSPIPAKPNVSVKKLATYVFDGVWCNTVVQNEFIMPEGAELKYQKGYGNTGYDKPLHSTSQTEVIGISEVLGIEQ